VLSGKAWDGIISRMPNDDYYFADYKRSKGNIFRLDTRIYLHHEANPRKSTGRCIAAVIAKNPGAAGPKGKGGWGPVQTSKNDLLTIVRDCFIKAYDRGGKSIRRDVYVKVWNLFYLRDKNVKTAKKKIGQQETPDDRKSEKRVPPIVWFAWGGNDAVLNKYKKRFLCKKSYRQVFFYDYQASKIQNSLPSLVDFAKHPQGQKKDLVIKHLAKIRAPLKTSQSRPLH